MIYRKFSLLVGSIFLLALCASATAMEPCEQPIAGYHDVVESIIDQPRRGRLIASFTAYPSFAPEWGVRLFRGDSGFLLRALKFRATVWSTGYREVKPGYFERNPAWADTVRTVREIALSEQTGTALERFLLTLPAPIKRSSSSVMMDGVAFKLVVGAVCASMHSPEEHSRSGRLVALFETLKTQAFLPSDALRALWDHKVQQLLLTLSNSPVPGQFEVAVDEQVEEEIPTSEYVLVWVFGACVVAFAALPLLWAAAVSLVPQRLKKTRAFVFIAGALSYGVSCLFGLLALPFYLFAMLYSASVRLGETGVLVGVAAIVDAYTAHVVFVGWILTSLLVPIALRRAWPKYLAVNQGGNASASG